MGMELGRGKGGWRGLKRILGVEGSERRGGVEYGQNGKEVVCRRGGVGEPGVKMGRRGEVPMEKGRSAGGRTRE